MGNITGNHYSTGNISRSDSSPPLSCPDLELLVLACLWSTNTSLWFISNLHKLGIFSKLHQEWSKPNHNNANMEYFRIQDQETAREGEGVVGEGVEKVSSSTCRAMSVSNMITRILFTTEYQYIKMSGADWFRLAKIISRRIIVLSDLMRELSPVNWRRCG